MHFFFLVLSILSSQKVFSNAKCEDIFFKSGINHNVGISVEKYPFEHTRTLGDYDFFLGVHFYEHVKVLKESEVTVDLGAGLGLAHLEMSKELKTKSIVINSQNFLKHWSEVRAQLSQDGTSRINIAHEHTPGLNFPDMYTIKSIGGLARSDLVNVAQVLNIEVPRLIEKRRSTVKIDPTMVYKFAVEVIEKLEKTIKTETFIYKQDLVENVLPNIRNQASIVTDVFGAFFYSPKRFDLLKHIFSSLKIGGKAYISLVGFYQRNVQDEVLLKNGEKTTLIEYLLNKHGDLFSLDGDIANFKSSPPVLIFKKTDDPFNIKLEHVETLESYSQGGMIIPRTMYREI